MNKSELLNNCTNNKMKCIFFNPSQKIFIDKNDFDLNNLCNLEEIFISPFRQKETNDIEMKDLTIQGIPISKRTFSLTNDQYYKLIEFIKNTFNIYFNKDISLTFSHNRQYFDELSLDQKTIMLREIQRDELKDWKYCIKGGSNKYNNIVNKINNSLNNNKLKNLKEENENDEEKESDDGDSREWDELFKLLFYKNNNLKGELIFPNGEIVSLNKIPLKSKGKFIYNICFISINK